MRYYEQGPIATEAKGCATHVFRMLFDDSPDRDKRLNRYTHPGLKEQLLVPEADWPKHKEELINFVSTLFVDFALQSRNDMTFMVDGIRHPEQLGADLSGQCYCMGYWCKDRRGTILHTFEELSAMIKDVHRYRQDAIIRSTNPQAYPRGETNTCVPH